MIRNHVWFVTAISYISILFVVHILEKKTLFNYHRIDPFSSNFNFHLNTSHHFASVKSPFIRIHQRCIPTHLRNHRIVINPSQRKKKKLEQSDDSSRRSTNNELVDTESFHPELSIAERRVGKFTRVPLKWARGRRPLIIRNYTVSANR